MKQKCFVCLVLALCLALGLWGCAADGAAVYVQQVQSLSGSGVMAGDRFAGMVVAEGITQIQKDADKTVAELLVKQGDTVTQGQPLFVYDTDTLQLALDKQKLEAEQLKAMLESYTQQIAELENQRLYAPQSEQLRYTVEIQSLQVELKESQLNLQAKEKEIARAEALLADTTVYAPVAGRIQSVSESGMDASGNPTAYIVIQQEGAFRVEGSLGELQRGGIREGTRMRIFSRTDPAVQWLGTVTLVDYNNPSQGGSMGGIMIMPGYGTDSSLTQASSYPFYVAPDSTDGLLLGQHVYMEVDAGEGTGLMLPGGFVCYAEDGSAYVWAENRGKLEKRAVTLGEYDPMTDAYVLVSGLTGEDHIAFPDESLCAVGTPTTREELQAQEGGVE